MALSRDFQVNSYDVDSAGFVRPCALMRSMQQLAGDDSAQYGLSYRQMREDGHVFVLYAMKLEMNHPLRADDRYTLKTYSIDIHGVSFRRDFYFYKNDALIGKACTKWVLLDFIKRKILPPARLSKALPKYKDMANGVEVSKRLDVSDCTVCDKRRVYPSMLDENDHLNNCIYADITTDYLPPKRDHYVDTVEILFTHESTVNDELEISSALSEESNKVKIFAYNLTKDRPCFSAWATRRPVPTEENNV